MICNFVLNPILGLRTFFVRSSEPGENAEHSRAQTDYDQACLHAGSRQK